MTCYGDIIGKQNTIVRRPSLIICRHSSVIVVNIQSFVSFVCPKYCPSLSIVNWTMTMYPPKEKKRNLITCQTSYCCQTQLHSFLSSNSVSWTPVAEMWFSRNQNLIMTMIDNDDENKLMVIDGDWWWLLMIMKMKIKTTYLITRK